MHMGKLELHTGEAHIWKLRWRELETFWEWHKPLLEKEECQKAEHYRFYEDKIRYLAGKIAVRMLLKEYSGVEKIVLGKGKYGNILLGKEQAILLLKHCAIRVVNLKMWPRNSVFWQANLCLRG